ncbi:MAG TPA: SBBP repeat-containing protein, partial [Candidatus Sulfotelmatobacter sp.]|nr:SBBP repeat-containing protein [Candidatus Sulfotelmatobacter sp.]
DMGLATAVDAATNVYLAGLFSGTVAFGTSNLVSSGGTDVLLAKYDAAGRLLWATQAGGELGDFANSLAVDPAGNLLVVGGFESSRAVFGGWVLTNNYRSRDLFVAKYDRAGHALWARRAGTMGYDEAKAVATDSGGNVYVTGSYYDTILFDSIGLTNRYYYTNFFLTKYDPEGKVLWARTTTGPSLCQGSGVTVDAATNVYVTGDLLGRADFGSGSLTNTNSYLNGTVFVAKYDREGTLLWVRKGAKTGIGYGQAIVVDKAGEVYATSYKRDYGIGYLLSRYDGDGNVGWYRANAISCCTGDATYANGLALDLTGNPVLTGAGNGSIEGLTNYFTGGYVLKFRSDGEGFWMQRCGTVGNSVASDRSGGLYVAGRFTGQGFFGASNLVSAGANDAFLVKFGVRPPAITVGPASQQVVLGGSVVLRVSATGSGPLAYQWQFNGVNLAGATGSTLTLGSFKPAEAGKYSVIVQNTSGAIISQVAVLTFVPTLDFTRTSDALLLNWPGTFTLQTATNVGGPYEDVTSAPHHYTNWIGPGAGERFFRLRAPLDP